MRYTLIASLIALGAISAGVAQDPASKRREARQALEKKFEDAMTNASMEGFFTIEGRNEDKPPAKDVYRIESCKKSGGDVWIVTAYIGHSKATIPVPVEVRWAGDTPMIMLTDVGLPGMKGKFSTRLLIDGSLYAGTWSHDQVKGHMWGKMSKTPAESKEKEGK
jgi:hypothetical protein